MGDQLFRLQADFDELQRRVNEFIPGSGNLTTRGVQQQIPLDPLPAVIKPPQPPQDQQVKNGDQSYSVNGYFETVAAPSTDKVLESAAWFSNDSVVAAQALSFVDARTSSTNKTLKAAGHSTYNAAYCDWSLPGGFVRMTGTKSLDTPFPTSPVYPARTEYLGAIIARLNDTIVILDDCHLGAYLYNNTSGSEDVIKANAVFHLTGAVRGTPAATTERRYKIFARTDRGISFLSDEFTLDAAHGPSDADFASGNCDVFLEWDAISGILEYLVYRHDITAGKYRLLIKISSGANTYGDNNHIEAGHDDEGGYPSATSDRARCYAATSDGDLSNLPVNGIALKWADLFLNVPVPSPLAATGVGNQVLRLQLDKAMDRRMVDVTSTAGNKTVGSATGAFTALDTGRMATLYAADGITILHGPEALTFNDATHIDFATNVATTNAGVILYIVGGGDHGLLIDMIHVGYIHGAKYSFYPDDLNRTLAPAAAPNNSGQGGVGTGGGGDDPGGGGIIGCIVPSLPVAVLYGNSYEGRFAFLIRRGNILKSGNHDPNFVNDIIPSDCENIHILRTSNGVEVPCSPSQVFFVTFLDRRGVPLSSLSVGDSVLTCVGGLDEISTISEIVSTGHPGAVIAFDLAPGHRFLAGRLKLSWLKRLIRRLQRKRNDGFCYLHNRKLSEL